jgi:hypothetical protein
MKNLILATAVVMGALALTACQSTNNDPATNAAQSCVYQNGGYYIAGTTVPCSNTGITGIGGTPIPGTPIGGTGGGCTSYNNPYSPLYVGMGSYYVPMIDPSSGQPICVNIGQTNYNYIVYNDPSWNPSTPIYYCPYADPSDCYGYSQYGGYNQSSGICLGFGDDYGNIAGACIPF